MLKIRSPSPNISPLALQKGKVISEALIALILWQCDLAWVSLNYQMATDWDFKICGDFKSKNCHKSGRVISVSMHTIILLRCNNQK